MPGGISQADAVVCATFPVDIHALSAEANKKSTYSNPGPTPLRFPLHLRTSRDEGLTWSEPALLADRSATVGGWSICYPTLTELLDGTLAAIWAQIKSSTGELYGDIHAARIVLKK